MSMSLRRVQSLNILQNFQLSSRDVSRNLKRDFSLLSVSGTELGQSGLLSVTGHRSPFRTYYKHEVEVSKRIQWKRPERVPCILPEKSGDLSGLPEVDLNEPPPLFKDSTEFQTASETVKRIFGLKFQTSAERRQAKIDAMTKQVKRHKLDNKSVEVKIAKWTAIIRNLQEHTTKFPQDRNAKADLKEIIEFRKKRMKLLRTLDYRRFEWILETLDLLFKPAPSSHERVERKKSMRWLTAEYIEKVKEQKLNEYKEALNSQKIGFLKSKLSTMEAIVEEEKAFGVIPSFTEEDLNQVKETLRLKIEEEEKMHPSHQVEKEVY
ncbi:28S ribosomal protein S15, mitochondrial [Thrips palmi]|uniref:Small ribosomal subunit protein uS15m n=1 Tax=Thrips palmi TaxID=161013 RepID=A0A6P8YBB1_THRPL|nr:28S ribosomal protein S15, mitochondrial [Thrips palmi]